MSDENRTITDADVEAIVSSLEKRVTEKFWRDLGEGTWGVIKKTVITIILGLVAYGAGKGGFGQ